jgi:hypothetical protein
MWFLDNARAISFCKITNSDDDEHTNEHKQRHHTAFDCLSLRESAENRDGAWKSSESVSWLEEEEEPLIPEER